MNWTFFPEKVIWSLMMTIKPSNPSYLIKTIQSYESMNVDDLTFLWCYIQSYLKALKIYLD